MKIKLTAFWKWFWFAVAAIVAKGPSLVEIVSAAVGNSVQAPMVMKVLSFVLGLAGLLLTLHIDPEPTPSQAPPGPGPYRTNTPPPSALRPVPPPSSRRSSGAFAMGIAFAFAGTLFVFFSVTQAACSGVTPANVQNAEHIALDLTQASCSVVDTTGDAYVIFGCAIAEVAENAAITVTNLFVSAPASQAAAFAVAHPETDKSKALVPAYRAVKATAAVVPLSQLVPRGSR